MAALTCFKACDIRSKLGVDLNEDIAYSVGRPYAKHQHVKRVAVGADVRLSSELLQQALARGLMDGGADVIDIGMTSTEEVYFAAFHLDVDGGIAATAGHNPMDYNGIKLVNRGACPISGETGLKNIQVLAEASDFGLAVAKPATLTQQSILSPLIANLLAYVDAAKLKPLTLVISVGNGATSHAIDAIEAAFKHIGAAVTFIKVHHEADGNFPNGIPNPLLPDNRAVTADAIRMHQADMGIAWDGDVDHCFLFDEGGNFIEGYYIVGLLTATFLVKHPGEKIIHD